MAGLHGKGTESSAVRFGGAGRGTVITELVFVNPVTTICEACGESRYSDETLSYLYKGKKYG